jgi:hypothetical protein
MKKIVANDGTPLQDAIGKADEEVLIMRDGHAVALVIPFDDEDVEWYAREREPAFIASIADARKQVQLGNTITHEELKARLGLK